MKRIVTLTTDGGDREDFNVMYSKTILVTAVRGLSFAEDIFTNFEQDRPAFDGDNDAAIQEISRLGYSVEELAEIIIVTE